MLVMIEISFVPISNYIFTSLRPQITVVNLSKLIQIFPV